MEEENKVPETEASEQNAEVADDNKEENVAVEINVDELLLSVKKITEERDSYLEMAKRQMADFANYKRRTENAGKEAREESVRSTVNAFLPVLDNLERALSSAADEKSALKDGVEMVLRQMQKSLTSLHVEVIDPQGEAFDPTMMNAVMQGTEDEGEPGTVCAVLQKGYRIGENVIRHAMVKVVAG